MKPRLQSIIFIAGMSIILTRCDYRLTVLGLLDRVVC